MVAIVGSGLAGLLAANLLSHRDPYVYERQFKLPNNHSAVLRFRTSLIGDALNIPFKEVTLIKSSAPWKNPVADALAYSHKNTGTFSSDRSIIKGDVSDKRWIAPPNLIGLMAARLLPHRIYFNYTYNFQEPSSKDPNNPTPIVSTIPMPILMQELEYPHLDKVDFRYSNGFNIKAKIKGCNAYVSLLVPHPDIPFSRVSITGDEIIIETHSQQEEEFPNTFAEMNMSVAIDLLGIDHKRITDITAHRQRYSKINKIDEDIRKDFIFWATDNFGIFSLGRFATWRPGLLLDDLVKDIRLIDKWMSKMDRYSIAMAR